MILDFKEIPKANGNDGYQDTFELFSRDFFEYMGFVIIQHPDRGADGKKDLIIQEERKGMTGVTKINWLVSCKHFINSGKSVNDVSEPDITDRLKSHNCDGFIGFYSTLASSSLSNKLTNSNTQFEIYDRERIEKILLDNNEGKHLASRYFPISFEKFNKENPQPADIFSNPSTLYCEECGNDLIKNRNGIYVLLKKYDFDSITNKSEKYQKIYTSCKGDCDHKLRAKYKEFDLYDSGWQDINDILTPTIWLSRFFGFINGIYNNADLNDDTFEQMKSIFTTTFPHISRELTEKEKERITSFRQVGIL